MERDVRRGIANLLGSDDPDIRRGAALELEGQSDYAVVTALAAALQDENKGVRDAASLALKNTGGTVPARIVAEYITDTNIVTRNLAGDLLLGFGSVSVTALIPYLQNPDRDVRKFAADIIARVGDASSGKFLKPLLDDEDENVVLAAVEALGDVHDPTSVSDLIRVFHDREWARPSVADALGKIGGEDVHDFLVITLYKLMKRADADPMVLFAIIEALGRIGDPSAFDMLIGNLQKVQGKLRRVLIHSLVSIAERHYISLHFLALHKEYLVDAFRDSDASIRKSCARVLAGISDRDVTELLLSALGYDEGLDALILEGVANRPETFACAVARLEKAGTRDGAQLAGLLARLALEASRAVFRGTQASVGQEDIVDAVRVLRRLWEVGNEEVHMAVVDALFRLDVDSAVEFIDQLLNEPDPWLRVRVVELLGAVEHQQAMHHIARASLDEDDIVREAASGILEARGIRMSLGAEEQP